MRAKPRFNRHSLPPAYRDLNTWPTVSPKRLGAKKAVFLRREQAIRDYFADASLSSIHKNHGIHPTELRRLRIRCLEVHPDGRIWGFRALVPNKVIGGYHRQAPVKSTHLHQRGGYSGMLTQLLERFDDIRSHLEGLFTNDIDKQIEVNAVLEPRIPYKTIHKCFIEACRAHGLRESDWPLNTDNLGKRSIEHYLNSLFERFYVKATNGRFGRRAAQKLKTTGGGRSRHESLQLFQRVQLDAHKLHAFCVIDIPDLDGDYISVPIDRLWLIVIIECVSRAVLGYFLSLNRECNAFDFYQAIKNAIIPWQPRELTIPGLRYRDTWGIPSGVIPELAYAVWDECACDNARIHLADDSRELIEDVLHCKVNWGAVGDADRRAIVESFFHTLEENGFHRLFSTTGSHPKDGRRTNAEAEALKRHITLAHIEELLDVGIARYNGTTHSGIRSRTPLEMLKHRLAKGAMVRPLLPQERNRLMLLNYRVTKRVRGDLASGRRPFVHVEYADYTSSVLANSPHLIGTYLDLFIDQNDMRAALAYLDDGTEFGILHAKPPWDRTPHTLEMRRRIGRLRNRGIIQYTNEDDPTLIYNQHLTAEARRKKRARGELAKVQRVIKANEAEETTPPRREAAAPSSTRPIDYEALLSRYKTIR